MVFHRIKINAICPCLKLSNTSSNIEKIAQFNFLYVTLDYYIL